MKNKEELKNRQPVNLDIRQKRPTVKIKTVDIESPSADRRSLLYTYEPIRVLEVVALVEGSSPSVTWNLDFSNDTSNFTSLFNSNQTTTSTDTTKKYYPNVKLIEDEYWLWSNITSVGGTTNHFHLTLIYEQ